MGSKFKNMNEVEFTKIRALVTAGVSTGVIRQVTGRSYATVNYVQRSSTFKDYQTIIRAIVAKQKASKPTIEMPKSAIGSGTGTSALFPPKDPVVVELARLNSNIEKMLEDYKWVMEHAEIKTKKRWL